MRWVLVIPLQAYRRFAPRRVRGRCLFRETCSAHVLRRTRDGGLRDGLAAMRARFRQCRGGYRVLPAPAAAGGGEAGDGSRLCVHLADGTVLDERAAAARVVAPYRQAIEDLRASLNAAGVPGAASGGAAGA